MQIVYFYDNSKELVELTIEQEKFIIKKTREEKQRSFDYGQIQNGGILLFNLELISVLPIGYVRFFSQDTLCTLFFKENKFIIHGNIKNIEELKTNFTVETSSTSFRDYIYQNQFLPIEEKKKNDIKFSLYREIPLMETIGELEKQVDFLAVLLKKLINGETITEQEKTYLSEILTQNSLQFKPMSSVINDIKGMKRYIREKQLKYFNKLQES